LRVVPTALGWKSLFFLAVVTFVYFAAPYSNLFFLLLAFAFVLGASNLFSAVRNMAGVRGRVPSIAAVAAGAPVRVVAEIQAGGRARFGISLQLKVNGGRRQDAGCMAIAEGGAIEGTLPPLARGVHVVRAVRLASAWPLGLVRASVLIDAPSDVVVYPAPLALSEGGFEGGAGGDDGFMAAAVGMLQPSSLREFRAGDSLKRVHWRATARRDRPVVAEWEGGQGEGFEFVLDRRAQEDELEHALSTLVTVAHQARELKEPLTLHSQGLSATFGGTQGRTPWDALWRFLADARALGADAPAPPPAGPHVVRLPKSSGGAQ